METLDKGSYLRTSTLQVAGLLLASGLARNRQQSCMSGYRCQRGRRRHDNCFTRRSLVSTTAIVTGIHVCWRPLLAGVLAMLCGGCMSVPPLPGQPGETGVLKYYDGPPRPIKELAVITFPPPYVTAIGSFRTCTNITLAVNPGVNDFRAFLGQGGFRSVAMSHRFNLEGGHRYVVGFRTDPMLTEGRSSAFAAELLDITTKENIATILKTLTFRFRMQPFYPPDEAVMNQIADPSFLAEIVKSTGYLYDTRCYAAERLSDQQMLFDTIMDPSMKASSSLDDLLAKAVKDGKMPPIVEETDPGKVHWRLKNIRSRLCHRMSAETLARVVQEHPDEDVRRIAAEAMSFRRFSAAIRELKKQDKWPL
jgi:hypothetical protein